MRGNDVNGTVRTMFQAGRCQVCDTRLAEMAAVRDVILV